MEYKCPKCNQKFVEIENDCLRHRITHVDIVTFLHCNDCDYKWKVIDRYNYEETFVEENSETD